VIDAPVTDAERVELQRRRHHWGQLRRWLKDQIDTWSSAAATHQHHRDLALALLRNALHEMDMLRAGNRGDRNLLRGEFLNARDELSADINRALGDVATFAVGVVRALGTISREEAITALQREAHDRLEALR
jgi:hypothetical protein